MKYSEQHEKVVSAMNETMDSLIKDRKENESGTLEGKDFIERNNNAGKIISAGKTVLESFKVRADEIKLCLGVKAFIKEHPEDGLSPEIKEIAGTVKKQ